MSKSRKRSAEILGQDTQREHTQEYCGGKLCLSEAEARARINGTKKRQHWLHSKVIPKRACRCPDCGCYHLTILPKYDCC